MLSFDLLLLLLLPLVSWFAWFCSLSLFLLFLPFSQNFQRSHPTSRSVTTSDTWVLTSYVATLARENLLQNVQQGHPPFTSKEIKGKSKPVQAASPARELGGNKRAAGSMMGNEEDGGTSGGGKRQKTTEYPSGPLHQTLTPSPDSLLPTTTITTTNHHLVHHSTFSLRWRNSPCCP